MKLCYFLKNNYQDLCVLSDHEILYKIKHFFSKKDETVSTDYFSDGLRTL